MLNLNALAFARHSINLEQEDHHMSTGESYIVRFVEDGDIKHFGNRGRAEAAAKQCVEDGQHAVLYSVAIEETRAAVAAFKRGEHRYVRSFSPQPTFDERHAESSRDLRKRLAELGMSESEFMDYLIGPLSKEP